MSKLGTAAVAKIYRNPGRYWNFLSETLSILLERPDAADLVDKIKKEIEKAPLDEQTLFFHTEPLDVALVVTGRTSDPNLISRYLSLVKQQNWDRDSEHSIGGRWRRAR